MALSYYLHGRDRRSGGAAAGKLPGHDREGLMQFLSGPLLFGLVLASVPLIIHLLNRRRFELVEWAPMKYLKLTVKNNRRRLRIEQLLLLLLRTLLIILLVVTVARPVLSKTGIGSWLSRRSRVSRIVVLDDSLAMGYRQDGHAALELGKEAAAEVLRMTGAQDSVTFFTTAPASHHWFGKRAWRILPSY